MDTRVCDEFLLDSANTGLTPCGVMVGFPDSHKAFHVFLEGWMAWISSVADEVYRGKPGGPPQRPTPPDPKNRT